MCGIYGPVQRRVGRRLCKLVCALDNRGNRGDRFQTAKVPATALMSIFCDNNVPNFTRPKSVPVEEAAIEHNSGTNATSHLYHDQVVFVVFAPEHVLG